MRRQPEGRLVYYEVIAAEVFQLVEQAETMLLSYIY